LGPEDPKDVSRDTAPDLLALVGKLAALKEYATEWLTDPEYEVLRYRLEAAHAAAEAVLVEAKPKGMFELGVGAVWAKAKFSEPPNCQAHLLFVNRENFIWGAAIIKRS
jgi:hypothetical protein